MSSEPPFWGGGGRFGFRVNVSRVSPPQHCEFRMRGHYHCLRPGCYFVTNITTKLPWHVKKHEKAERRAANGFKYFTKREECGRLGKAAINPPQPLSHATC